MSEVQLHLAMLCQASDPGGWVSSSYFERGLTNGTLSTIKSFKEHGFAGIAYCFIPSTKTQ